MADIPQFNPNPYADFDPSQWSNPYSSFQSSGIPFPASYSGWPTDAMGNPIKPPPGMTINSSPAQPPAPAPAASNPSQWAINNAMISAMGSPMRGGVDGGGRGAYQGMDVGNVVNLRAQNNAAYGLPPSSPSGAVWNPTSAAAAMGGQGASGPPQAAANPGGLTSQQYLQLRANPGRVVTPGATVPQAQSGYQPNNNVLQQFLANWSPAQSGPGSGFQQQFAKALGK